MKKTNFMTAVLLVIAVLLLAACSNTNVNDNPGASSSLGGAVEDNNLFDGNPTSYTSQPTTGASAPSSNATTPSSGATVPSTGASQGATQPTTPKDPGAEMDYETFRDMTGAEQRAFQESFKDLDAFFAWYNAAKAAYEKENPPIEIGGDGVIDMGTLPSNKG